MAQIYHTRVPPVQTDIGNIIYFIASSETFSIDNTLISNQTHCSAKLIKYQDLFGNHIRNHHNDYRLAIYQCCCV